MKTFRLLSQSEKKPGTLDIWSMLLPVTFDVICGILLIVLGNLALRVTSYALAAVMIGFSVWLIITYVRSSPLEKITGSSLAVGLALAVSGVLLALNPEYLEEFFPFIWGLALLFGAFLKVQYAFNEKAVKIEKWWIMLILAGVSLIVGILCLANPPFISNHRELIIGIMLIAEAVIDFVVYLMISKALKRMIPTQEQVHDAIHGTPADTAAAAAQTADPAAAVPVPGTPAPEAPKAPEFPAPDTAKETLPG